MYDAVEDPYCYPGTTILRNIPDIREQNTLEEFEAAMTAQRADEPLPTGRMSVAHYRAVHHHLFQDVYAWAGIPRTVRISKDGNAFCYPEHIGRELKRLFGGLQKKNYFRNFSREQFAHDAAAFLSTLNAVHPFREGNGRTQTAFLVLLAAEAGHPLTLPRLKPDEFLAAMIASFRGNDALLEEQILELL